MRLSTAPERDEDLAGAVLDRAIEDGVELLDTADAYAAGEADVGHNERLIAAALARAARRPKIVTKGGLVRPGGAWVPDGRARHLAAAARASRDRLGVDAIDLYLLHAVDPRTPLATSVRALAALRDAAVARAIGLSNITPTQLEQALAIAPIEAVEIELGPWRLDPVRGGLIAACADRGIRVLAHRPLGGPAGARRIARDPIVGAIAARHHATPAEVVLAWLRSLSPVIVTLPGPTRAPTAASAIAGQRLVLDDEARRALADHFLAVGRAPAPSVAVPGEREVVLVVGMPAAGKSTLAETYAARGYRRLNRDDRGGSLLDLARALDAELAAGATRVVVDGTYPTRASRAPIVEVARRHAVDARCVVVATPLEAAQAFAAGRVLERRGSLDDHREIRPGVQFRWRREYEPPRPDEGFAAIDERVPPRRPHGTRAGLVVELDGIVWVGRPLLPAKIELVPGARAGLAAWTDHVVAATLWRPGAAPEAIAALAARLAELVGRAVDVRHCPHPAGPPRCWCRKPLPGLGVAIARDHDLDPARSIHLGKTAADRGFAVRAGLRYAAAGDGWPVPPA